jgi:hypothetical protein
MSAVRVVVVQEVVVPTVKLSGVAPVLVEVRTPAVIVPSWTAAAAGLAMATKVTRASPTATTERRR